MITPLVVLTYPGHFVSTALTVKSYFQYNSLRPVIIVADDIGYLSWPEYIKDCELFYQTDVIPASKLSFLQEEKDGWIRQQILKLYLDQLIEFDSWLFTDGDIEFRYPVPEHVVPCAMTAGGEVQDRQNAFVKNVLGIESVGVFDLTIDSRQLCVSNPPFRSMYREDLEQLRIYIETRHHCNILSLRMNLTHSVTLMSEWELLENFKIYCLNRPSKIVHYPTVPSGAVKQRLTDPDFCYHQFLSGADIGREYFQQQGIDISDELWKKIEKISK